MGAEGILQLFQAYVLHKNLHNDFHNPIFEPVMLNEEVEWHYRGQVVPKNKEILIDISIQEERQEYNAILITGTATLRVDGLKIYVLPKVGIRVYENVI